MRPFIDKAIRRSPSSPRRRWPTAAPTAISTIAEETLRQYSATRASSGTQCRLQVARALGDVKNPAFRPLLVPLMYDANLDVARAAIESAGTLGAGDFLFVPPLVSLLRNRRLKSAARAVLVGYGEEVVAPLAYFMRDRDEDIWIRRHVPSTLALLPFRRRSRR